MPPEWKRRPRKEYSIGLFLKTAAMGFDIGSPPTCVQQQHTSLGGNFAETVKSCDIQTRSELYIAEMKIHLQHLRHISEMFLYEAQLA